MSSLYYCKCAGRCKRGRWVSRSTWHAHKNSTTTTGSSTLPNGDKSEVELNVNGKRPYNQPSNSNLHHCSRNPDFIGPPCNENHDEEQVCKLLQCISNFIHPSDSFLNLKRFMRTAQKMTEMRNSNLQFPMQPIQA